MSEYTVVFEERPLKHRRDNNPELCMGLIHLNKPTALNAIDLQMIQVIQRQLNRWRDNARVAFILMDAEGDKAFCAGGDVKALFAGRRDTQQGIENPSALKFFDEEYALNYDLHSYPKPIICWGTGIVMGGGIGLLVACSHRIVTETSNIAMPEIVLGLYPDVGSSWFFNRSPGKTGLFMGLTGIQINGHDAKYAGLADRFINAQYKTALLEELLSIPLDIIERTSVSISESITNILKNFEVKSQKSFPASNLKKHFETIDACCDFENPVDIYHAIQLSAKQSGCNWLKQAANNLKAGNPSSVHIIFEQIKRAKHLSLEEAFLMERNISARYMSSYDFYEGVRALLVDKDKKPQWQHQSIESVSYDFVEEYF